MNKESHERAKKALEQLRWRKSQLNKVQDVLQGFGYYTKIEGGYCVRVTRMHADKSECKGGNLRVQTAWSMAVGSQLGERGFNVIYPGRQFSAQDYHEVGVLVHQRYDNCVEVQPVDYSEFVPSGASE